MNIIVFTTKTHHSDDNIFSWDTDEIPFIVNNPDTGIISNVHKLCFGPIITTRVTPETYKGLNTSTKYAGIMRLVLTDNLNKHHTYDIPECVYDPEAPIKIIRVLYLGKYFGNQENGLYKDEGITVKPGITKSHFV